jgi:hypothetical protein
MASFNSGSDPELEYRRKLLAAARQGKSAAMQELQKEFKVRLYSATERASLSYAAIPQSRALSRRDFDLGMEWAQGEIWE